MAFRGGRGRRRAGGQHPRKQEELFIKFPEIKEYPTIDLKDIDKEFMTLSSWSFDLHNFWISSSYHLEDGAKKNGGIKRRPLSDFIKMTDEYVPAELVAKKVNVRRENKKVRWDPKSELQRLDFFETMDRAPQGDQDDDDDEEEDEDELDDDDEEEDEDELDEDEEEDDAPEEEVEEEPCGCSCKVIKYYDDEVEYYNNEDLGDDDGYY